MKKTAFYLFLMIIVFSFSACEDHVFESFDETPGLKKGSKKPTDVQYGDLYGDLVEVEIDSRGVPVLYPLLYRADYKDNIVEGTIDVANPRLDGPFNLTIYVRDDEGYVIMDTPGVFRTVNVTIEPGEDGFISNYSPIVLYDAEGEILETVTLHVYPIEQGRLNLIRSSPDVLSRRIFEVIKNFGNGTVAAVIRDFCGRLFMVRTQAALDLGIQDKPIDSPLENMALYNELMLYGFDRPVEQGGLYFLVDQDIFHFKTKVDKNWGPVVYDYFNSVETKRFIVMNLAASCIAAASDKSNELKLDEILLVNRFLGIPLPIGNAVNTPAESVISYFPYVEQRIRMMDKTNKSEYAKYRYYIDYSFFWYTRQKFQETLIDYYTIEGIYDPVTGSLIGSYKNILANDLTLHEILLGEAPLTIEDIEKYRYTDKEGESIYGAVGFANQADDYVQALEVIHDNEEFLIWEMPTPTWSVAGSPILRLTSPFNYVPDENDGGNGEVGNGGKGNGGKSR